MNNKTHLESLMDILNDAEFEFEEERHGTKRTLTFTSQDGTDIIFKFDDDTEELLDINV